MSPVKTQGVIRGKAKTEHSCAVDEALIVDKPSYHHKSCALYRVGLRMQIAFEQRLSQKGNVEGGSYAVRFEGCEGPMHKRTFKG